MQLRGTLQGVLRDLQGNVIISFNVGQKVPQIGSIEGKDLDIRASVHREKRTMSQNAYYWVLCSKLAAKLNISTARLHNMLLREVGYPFIIDGKTVMNPIPDTDKAEEECLEATTFHLKPTSGVIVGNDKALYRWYIVLRGSSTFDTAEMTALLNRMVEECKDHGIETLPPEELERMRREAERNRHDKD